ncbi:MAG: hypothetical protein ACOCZ2_01580 [Thermodesulfobacteriota bacterium]
MQFQLFDDIITSLRKKMDNWPEEESKNQVLDQEQADWPGSRKNNIVFQSDTAVELGSPDQESVSFILWTNDLSLVNHNTFSLYGPDLPSCGDQSMPFGKVIVLGGSGFDEDNCYERHQEIDLARYDLNLEGYMIRAVSQYMREWSRISKTALERGFDFPTLAKAIRDLYLEFDYIRKVETIFVTSSILDVRELNDLGRKATDRIVAMNRIAGEMNLDCDSCDLQEVCNDAIELRKMHRKRMKQ